MIRIFTDTAANLPPELLEKHGIRTLSLTCLMDGAVQSEADFNGHAFYDAMRRGAQVQTSMVSPGAAREAFEACLQAGEDVLYVGVSSGISGTCWGVSVVAHELAEQYPQRQVAVADTKAASLGEGLMVLRAAALAQEKPERSASELAALVEAECRHMCQFFVVDELKYLHKGGRISGVAALAGTLLQIKPILRGDEEGRIVLHSKLQGKLRALDRMAKLYAEKRLDPHQTVGIAHADSPGDALRLQNKLREQGLTGDVLSVCYEPVTGCHVGPGTVALFFLGESR